MFSGIIYFSHL